VEKPLAPRSPGDAGRWWICDVGSRLRFAAAVSTADDTMTTNGQRDFHKRRVVIKNGTPGGKGDGKAVSNEKGQANNYYHWGFS
jgi:hypothetical protein